MLDRNTVIGLVLIGAILIAFSIINAPSREDVALQQRKNDSIQVIKKQKEKELQQKAISNAVLETLSDTLPQSDSLIAVNKAKRFGPFAAASEGDVKTVYLENDLIKVKVLSKGAKAASVELKKFKDHLGKPLQLFHPDSTKFGLTLVSGNLVLSTDSLYFVTTSSSPDKLVMTLPAGEGRSLIYTYSLKPGSYVLDFKMTMNRMDDLIPGNVNALSLKWATLSLQHEKNLDAERGASTVSYLFSDGESDRLSESETDASEIQNNLKWIAFRQQYFSAAVFSEKELPKPSSISTRPSVEAGFNKFMTAELTLPFDHQASVSHDLHFYYGPNHFQTLKKLDIGLEELIPLGWGILGWINRFCVIPIFNFFEGFNLNYGIIILILTLVIKIVLFPLTFRAYLSSARMKVLKPEMDEINEKYAKEDPMKKQQAIMSLYRSAGVNPFGGCLPLLLQMPILFAMFRFFPASIELRQKSFLWADDLSTYDSILDLSFNIPFYGDHVSLFTLLMTVSTILYTRMNSSQFSGPQMAQMKIMMYAMPVIFLGVFNNYSSGLSYYYFLANMITFGQQFLFRKFVDDDAIHAKIQENKKRPAAAKKSRLQQRLEEMQKQQQLLQKQRQNQGSKPKKK